MTMASPEKIQETIAAYFVAIRAMDKEAWLNTFAADSTSHDPVGTPPLDTREKRSAFFDGVTSSFERVGLQENQVFVAGNGAAVKWTGSGTGKNGRAVTFEGIDVIEMDEEGKIKSLWAYWDPAAMMADLMG
ncbi:MAG: nuclear transport factor 2 family protein [Acidobacteria bacterium]|nr:nuclear transport factor 2 family protein [Acidobacteriota bacterium]